MDIICKGGRGGAGDVIDCCVSNVPVLVVYVM